jgi:hypothetical protein
LLKSILQKPKRDDLSQIKVLNRKILAASKYMSVTVIGIANSVELFQGDMGTDKKV